MSDWTEEMTKAATAKGLVVVRPKANELFLDIDDAESLATFHKGVGFLGTLVHGFTRKPSPSGAPDRLHVTVTLGRDVKDQFERIALQALLGSDRLHEMLCWEAATRGVLDVCVFFEKPQEPDSR